MKIFRGDDTGGILGKRIVINVTSPFDLSGCIIVFNYQGVTRRWSNVKNGDQLEVFFSHNETSKMTVGTFKGVMFAIDASGKYRTINNALPIEVTTNLKSCYGDDSFDVSVGTAVDWRNIVNKPLDGKTIDISMENGIVAALGTIIEHLGGTVK